MPGDISGRGADDALEFADLARDQRRVGEEAFTHTLRKLGEKHGFDDIVSLVPVSGVTEQAADFLAEGGWLNIFAGVARGTMAPLILAPTVVSPMSVWSA